MAARRPAGIRPMRYNADAHDDFRDLLELTRRYLQQQVAAGRPEVTLRPGTWESLTEALARPAPAAPARGNAEAAAPARKETPRFAMQSLFGGDELARFTTLQELGHFASDCQRCALCEGRTQVVFGVGNPEADVVFVGEAPGRDEDLQGEPFVGRAGQLLTKIIETMLEPWTRGDVYICNVIKCRPPDNRDPLQGEIDACEPYLLRQLELLQPAVILTLGKFAAQTLLREKTGMMRLRGQWREYHGLPLMPLLHPAYILRNPKEGRRLMFEDMKRVRAKLEELGLL